MNLPASGYGSVGGVMLGAPISAPFTPVKHLETSSYIRAFGQDNTWLGILQTLDTFRKVKMPFISMTELNKNFIEVNGAGHKLRFGVPFVKGCPFLLENLCKDTATPGLGNQPFFIVMSENVYNYGDVITNDKLNGVELRIQAIKDKGQEAEIVPHGNGWRYMVALDGMNPDDYVPQEFLEEGTPFYKMYSINGGEFENHVSSYSGINEGDRTALQMYEYTVGDSLQGIRTWITADATYRISDVNNNINHPSVMNMPGAALDVLTYFTEQGGRKTTAFWIPTFIEKMVAELATMKENKLIYSKGKKIISNGREQVITGLGVFQQIRQRGNWDTYTNFDEMFNLIMNFSEKLFSFHNQVPVDDRFIRLKAGRLAYTELVKRFKKYFQTDNPFIVTADHPALVKAGLLKVMESGGLRYTPMKFDSIVIPGQGTIIVEHDETYDRLYDYQENPQQAASGTIAKGIIFIEDITDGSFSNAIPQEIRQSGRNYKNITMIKRRNWKDRIEFKVGSQCNETVLKMLNVPGNGFLHSDNDKGLQVTAYTEGEAWVQDPSRCWLIEYDPYGTINRSVFDYSNPR